MRATLPAIKPTVAEILGTPRNLTFRLPSYDPDFPVYGYTDIVDCDEEVAELEALHRWAMVLHNQYPWDRSQVELAEVGQLRDDDYVVVFHPRTRRCGTSCAASGPAACHARLRTPRRRVAADPALPGGRRAQAVHACCPGSRRWPWSTASWSAPMTT